MPVEPVDVDFSTPEVALGQPAVEEDAGQREAARRDASTGQPALAFDALQPTAQEFFAERGDLACLRAVELDRAVAGLDADVTLHGGDVARECVAQVGDL